MQIYNYLEWHVTILMVSVLSNLHCSKGNHLRHAACISLCSPYHFSYYTIYYITISLVSTTALSNSVYIIILYNYSDCKTKWFPFWAIQIPVLVKLCIIYRYFGYTKQQGDHEPCTIIHVNSIYNLYIRQMELVNRIAQ